MNIILIVFVQIYLRQETSFYMGMICIEIHVKGYSNSVPFFLLIFQLLILHTAELINYLLTIVFEISLLESIIILYNDRNFKIMMLEILPKHDFPHHFISYVKLKYLITFWLFLFSITLRIAPILFKCIFIRKNWIQGWTKSGIMSTMQTAKQVILEVQWMRSVYI